MEIPAQLYFSFCSLISITSLKFGFQSLEKESSNFSLLLIFSLKRFLGVCVCHSSTYALVHRYGANNASLFNHLKLSILGFSFLFYVSIFLRPIPLTHVLCYALVVTTIISLLITTVDTGLHVDFIVRSITFSLEVGDDTFFPAFVLVASFFSAGIAAIYGGISSGSGPNRSDRIEPVQLEASSWRKIVVAAASASASFAFHLLVRFESVSQVVALLWFAVAWLGCIAMTIPRFELGLFYLLVCNVMVGCSTRFGFSGPTWLAGGVSVVLLVLHDDVVAMRFVDARDAIVW